MPSRPIFAAVLVIVATCCGVSAQAEPKYTLMIKDHQFVPAEISVPAGEKIILTVKNLDSTPSEFESADLNREKIVVGGSSITVFIGPLRAGRYEFFDDFNPATVHGHIIAK